MKLASLPHSRSDHQYRLLIYLSTLAVLSLTILLQSVHAQPAQLSLADILIALRSKKAPMLEKNKLLGDAVKTRGITFALTPEIEKELQSTGADLALIDAIRQKNPLVKAVAAIQPKPAPVPVSTPPPPDFNFYQKRAGDYAAKGEFEMAIVDYNKAIELKPGEASAYFDRGLAFESRKNYALAFGDFDKSIELDPKNPAAYVHRGNAYEKNGDISKAMADFQKAVDLDGNNEAAKGSLQRLQLQQAELNPEPKTKEPELIPIAAPVVAEAPKPAGLVNIGSLKNHAVKLAMPVYSAVDRQRNIQGIVTVQITLDEEGKVVDVKAVSGPTSLRATSEDAIRRSKFKPVQIGDKTVKATGFINYNFTGQ